VLKPLEVVGKTSCQIQLLNQQLFNVRITMAVTDNIYTPDDYNQHNVLKVPGYLPLILLYMLRYPVLYVLSYNPLMGSSLEFLEHFAGKQLNWLVLLASVPVLLIVAAMVQRTPLGSSFIRRIWQHGHMLLLFSISTSLFGILLYALLGWKSFNELFLVLTYLDFMLLLFLWRSKRIRDVFSEFPAYDPNYDPEKEKKQ